MDSALADTIAAELQPNDDINDLASLMIGHGARSLVKVHGHAKAGELLRKLVQVVEEDAGDGFL